MIENVAADTTDEVEEVFETPDVIQLKKKSVTGVISFFIRTLILQGIGLISALVLSAYFSPEDFGVYGLVIQIIGLLTFFSDIGLAAALIQREQEPSEQTYRAAFTLQQILAWLIVAICALILATGWVGEKTGTAGNWILITLALSFPVVSLRTVSAIKLERKLQFDKLVIPQIVENFLFHGVLITLAWRGAGPIAYAYAIAIRSIAGVLVMFWLQPWAIGLTTRWSSLRSILSFGVKFQLNDLLARIKDQLFFLLLGAWLPLREFGYIQWAKNWSLYPYNLTVQNITAVTFPTFSRLQGHPQLLRRAIEKFLFWITLVIFPILVGMCVFIQPVTIVVPAYAKWQPAIFSFIAFTLSVGWAAISSPLTNTLNALGKINQSLKLMILWTSLTWTITPLLVWKIGYDGVALAALLIAVTSVIPIWLVKKVVPFDVWDQIWRQLIAAGVMAGVGVVGLQWWSQGLVPLVVGMGVTSAIYSVVMLGLGWRKVGLEVASVLRLTR